MISLWHLYWTFFKMGIFTFGGGAAMLPILKNEAVDKNGWVSEEELLNYYSVGQCTPGIIAVNTASFIGYKLRALPGLISATMGVISPSVIVILIIAVILKQFTDNQYVQWAFSGIRICVVALILNTVWDTLKKSVKTKRDIIVFIIAALLLWCLNLSPIAIVILAALGAFIPDFTRKKS